MAESKENMAQLSEAVGMDQNIDDTTPGQDLTMDASYNMEPRSPSFANGGSSSPRYGRSVREFEEQMTALKKENFNLKLRIYFLEEKLPPGSSSPTEGSGNLIKENVDLKIDIEILRKELADKQTLLCDAAKALELMECQQKEIQNKHEATIDELHEKIRFLEAEIKELEKKPKVIGLERLEHSDSESDISIQQKVQGLEQLVREYEEQLEELKAQNEELSAAIIDRDEKIKLLEEKIKQILYDNAVLQEQLTELFPSTKPAEKSNDDQNKLLHKKNEELESYVSENKSLKEIIIKLNDELKREKICNEEKMKKVKEQQATVDEMQKQMITTGRNVLTTCKIVEEYGKVINELMRAKDNAYEENDILKRRLSLLETITATNDILIDGMLNNLPRHSDLQNSRKSTASIVNPLFLSKTYRTDETSISELCSEVCRPPSYYINETILNNSNLSDISLNDRSKAKEIKDKFLFVDTIKISKQSSSSESLHSDSSYPFLKISKVSYIQERIYRKQINILEQFKNIKNYLLQRLT